MSTQSLSPLTCNGGSESKRPTVQPKQTQVRASRRQLKRLLPSFLPLLIAASLCGCAATTPIAEINASKTSNPAVCRSLKPVHWSPNDTRMTIDEIRRNNAARAKACR
jgi:hypothetical protein